MVKLISILQNQIYSLLIRQQWRISSHRKEIQLGNVSRKRYNEVFKQKGGKIDMYYFYNWVITVPYCSYCIASEYL